MVLCHETFIEILLLVYEEFSVGNVRSLSIEIEKSVFLVWESSKILMTKI